MCVRVSLAVFIYVVVPGTKWKCWSRPCFCFWYGDVSGEWNGIGFSLENHMVVVHAALPHNQKVIDMIWGVRIIWIILSTIYTLKQWILHLFSSPLLLFSLYFLVCSFSCFCYDLCDELHILAWRVRFIFLSVSLFRNVDESVSFDT